MDFLGTKTPGEREDEEAGRLVRPQPKLKPPRRDKRRERMDVDSDSDIDSDPDTRGDPDLSMNYKSIGGSANLLSVVRLAKEPDRVKVRRKEDGKIVEVTKDTLRERGGEYEKYEQSGEEGQDDRKSVQELSQRVKEDPSLANNLKMLLKPNSDLYLLAEGNPKYPAAVFHKNIPPGIKTLGDLVDVAKKVFAEPEAKPKKPKKTKAPKDPPAEAPKTEPVPEKADPGKKPGLPAIPPQLTETIKNLVKLIPPAERKNLDAPTKAPKEGVPPEAPVAPDSQTPPEAEKPSEPAPEAPKKAPKEKSKGKPPEAPDPAPKPEVKRRVPSSAEVEEARHLVVNTFPPRLAGKFIEMHPDDIRNLVANFNEFKSLGPIEPGNIESELAKAGKVTFNPEKVAPPETVERDGKKVKLADLSPEEQLEETQRHRTALIGAQLALRSRAISSMRKAGTPRKLAQKLTDFALLTNGMSPEEKMRKAQEKARDLFVAASSDSSIMEDARFGVPSTRKQDEKATVVYSRKSALESVKDTATKALLISAFQGEDYRRMVAESFGPRAKNPIGSKDSVSSIVEKIKQAETFFKGRSNWYPEELRSGLEDPATLFRVRVRQAVSDMDPKKAKKLSKALARLEADAYDEAKETYFKAYKEYRESLKEWKYDSSEDPKKAKPIPLEPKMPKKPATYDAVRSPKNPKEVQTKLDQLLGVKKAAYSSYLSGILIARCVETWSPTNQAEETMTIKFAKEDADRILGRLEKMASAIQNFHSKWGMDFATAKALVNDLDRTADEIEKAAYGEDSFYERQIEVLKEAKVIQQDSDEKYMGTFNAPMAPKQTDSDEKYMSQFKDDQSQAVATGKSETGRPLAP